MFQAANSIRCSHSLHRNKTPNRTDCPTAVLGGERKMRRNAGAMRGGPMRGRSRTQEHASIAWAGFRHGSTTPTRGHGPNAGAEPRRGSTTPMRERVFNEGAEFQLGNPSNANEGPGSGRANAPPLGRQEAEGGSDSGAGPFEDRRVMDGMPWRRPYFSSSGSSSTVTQNSTWPMRRASIDRTTKRTLTAPSV